MKNLKEILEQEQKEHIIKKYAQKFRFKNVKLFFNSNESPLYLNLVVEVDEDLEGDANAAHLLEVKLTETLQVDVVVLVASRITDWLNKKIVTNNSIPIDADLIVEAEKLLKKSIDKLALREAPKKSISSKRRFKSADDFLKIQNPSIKKEKSLKEILEQEKREHIIVDRATRLGFKDNVVLFEADFVDQEKSHLNLFVEVDYENGGNANHANLLEALLTEALEVDVTVICRGEVGEIDVILNDSFALDAEDAAIKKIYEKLPEDVILKEPKKPSISFNRRLKLADSTLKEVENFKQEKKSKASSNSNLFFQRNNSKQSMESGVVSDDRASKEESEKKTTTKFS